MRILLRDLSPGTQYALKFRSNDGYGGVSEWSQIQRFTTTNDLTHPGNVANLSWSDTGNSLMAVWDRVVLNQDGTPFNDFRSYHVQVTDGTTTIDYYPNDSRFELSQEMNIAAFGTYKNNLTIKVWAVDLTHNESLVAATATASPAAPPTPSTPVVGNYLGLLLVTWDGKQANGTAMPTNTNYCEVHVSTTSNFTPSSATYIDKVYSSGAAAKITLTGLAYGTTYYVRLVAVSYAGKSSGPSVQASGVPARISGLDIQNGQISTAQINFTAYDIGGANAYYPATTTAMNAITGAKANDIAYVTGSGYVTYRYNGTTWVLAPEIGVVQGSKILAGTVTSNAVGTNLLITNKANIGNAVIDQANIATVNAASITTGQLSVGQKIIAGPATDTHAEMSDTGFRVFRKDPVSSSVDEVIRLGTTSNDYFAIVGSSGQLMASVDDTGKGNFSGLSSQAEPIFQGQALSSTIQKLSPQVVGYFECFPPVNSGFSDYGPITSRVGIMESNAFLTAGRRYSIRFKSTWYAGSSTGASPIPAECRYFLLYTGPSASGSDTAATPTLSSSEVDHFLFPANYQGGWQTAAGETTFVATTTGRHRFLLAIELGQAPGQPAVAEVMVVSSLKNIMVITDTGSNSPLVGVQTQAGGSFVGAVAAPPPPPPTQQYYVDIGYDNHSTYRGNGSLRTDTSDVVQGWDPSGFNGDGYGWYGFGNKPNITGNVDRVDLYIYFNLWYYNSGGSPIINIIRAGDASTLAGFNSLKLRGNYVGSGWPRPGGVWFTLPSDWWPFFKTGGGMYGISLGQAGGTNEIYYGRASDCRLRIWYTQ